MNAFINGDMNLKQRGGSFVAPTNGQYTLDQYQYVKVGSMVHTVSRDTDVPATSLLGRKLKHSLKLACTTAQGSLLSSSLCTISQPIEGFRWLNYAEQDCYLAFAVKAHKPGTYCVALQNVAQDRSLVLEYTVNTADTWEAKVLSVPASPSSGTWDFATGKGVTVHWVIAAGSSWQGSAGSWNSVNQLASSNQVNGVDSTANDFRITALDLMAGSLYAASEVDPFDDLERAQRYCRSTFDFDTDPAQNVHDNSFSFSQVGAASSTMYQASYPLSPVMHHVPDVTLYSPQRNTGNIWNATAGGDCPVSAIEAKPHNILFLCNPSATAPGSKLAVHFLAEAPL